MTDHELPVITAEEDITIAIQLNNLAQDLWLHDELEHQRPVLDNGMSGKWRFGRNGPFCIFCSNPTYKNLVLTDGIAHTVCCGVVPKTGERTLA